MTEESFQTTDPAELSELISKRAYDFYQQRGYEDGHDWEDWLLAEAEIRKEQAGESATTPKKKAHRLVAA